MLTIYTVVKFYQESDGDGWDHWTGEDIVSYHQSVTGAEDKIKELLVREEKNVLESIPLNPYIRQERWDERIAEIRANTQSIRQGTDDEYEETPRYSIRSIAVKP
jgi:hypothetical protein